MKPTLLPVKPRVDPFALILAESGLSFLLKEKSEFSLYFNSFFFFTLNKKGSERGLILFFLIWMVPQKAGNAVTIILFYWKIFSRHKYNAVMRGN